MRQRHGILLSIAGVLLSADVVATCDFSMTGEECKAAVEQRLRLNGYDILPDDDSDISATEQQVIRSTEDLLERMNTGLSSALSDGGVTTVEDFLPKWNLFATGGDSDEADAIVVEVNNVLNLPTDRGYKFRLTLNQPELFDPLIESIPEAMRANTRNMLDESLDDFDDVALSFVYNANTQRMGRARHADHADLFNQIFADARADHESRRGGGSASVATADMNWRASANRLEQLIPDGRLSGLLSDDGLLTDAAKARLGDYCSGQLDTPRVLGRIEVAEYELLRGEQILCAVLAASANPDVARRTREARSFDALKSVSVELTEVVAEFVAANEARYVALYADLDDFQKTLKRFGAFGLPRLIDNQPQLLVTAELRERDVLIGPNSWSAKVTYEHGFVNVNTFRSYLDTGCGEDLVHLCLDDYLSDPAREAHLKRSDRLSFSLEYSRTQSYDATVASGAGMLQLPTAESWLGSLGYGRYLSFDDLGRARTRIELTATYEDVDGDEMRRDRFLGNLTFSQQITDQAALSFSIVYANKPEYRGEVTKEFTALLGINYKLFAPGSDGL